MFIMILSAAYLRRRLIRAFTHYADAALYAYMLMFIRRDDDFTR